MFVKKFEADTLEEALKAVKLELGPDAIILKTITNNGLKGAFKKKRIEITAAISEKSFEKKAKVDKVLNQDQKEALYQKPASSIKETITKYNGQNSPAQAGGYGNLGLNKVVNTLAKGTQGLSDITQKTSSIIKSSLDDFLNEDEEVESYDDSNAYEEEEVIIPRRAAPRVAPVSRSVEAAPEGREFRETRQTSRYDEETANLAAQTQSVSREAYNELKQEMKTQQHKIDLLEKKLSELSQNYQFNQKYMNEAQGLYQLRTTLKTLGIDEGIIVELIKKASYEFSKEDLENPDVVFEFALREMADSIYTEIPLFAQVENQAPVVTVLMSEVASGQSSMGMKIAILKKDVTVIQFSQDAHNTTSTDFAAQVFGIKVEKVQSFSEAVGLCRKSLEAGKSVLVDARLNSKFSDETKKFIETLKRGFQYVEVLGTLSGIHSEIYNRKIIARYKDLLDGVIISHVDLCTNFGSLFNVHKAYNKLPLKFFGTGSVVPDDIESATAERLMAGLFQF